MSKAKLKKSIKQYILSQLTEYEFFEDKSYYLWPNEVAIISRQDSIDLFIVFSPHSQDSSRFTVDIGWSRLKRFPEVDMRPCADAPDAQHSEFTKSEYFTRAGIVSGKPERWWNANRTGSFDQPIQSAAECIRETVNPYLQKLMDSESGRRRTKISEN